MTSPVGNYEHRALRVTELTYGSPLIAVALMTPDHGGRGESRAHGGRPRSVGSKQATP